MEESHSRYQLRKLLNLKLIVVIINIYAWILSCCTNTFLFVLFRITLLYLYLFIFSYQQEVEHSFLPFIFRNNDENQSNHWISIIELLNNSIESTISYHYCYYCYYDTTVTIVTTVTVTNLQYFVSIIGSFGLVPIQIG